MRNSSQKAGCMRRSPDSHCCQVRQVVCTSAPAAVWDSPAASRTARMSAGAGLDAGPFGPLFGWLDMRAAHVDDVVAVVVLVDDIEISTAALAKVTATGAATHAAKDVANAAGSGLANHVVALETAFGNFDRANIGFGVVEFVCEGDGLGHFQLQPLVTRGAVAARSALHELNNTRIARKVNNYFQIFSRRRISPHNYMLALARFDTDSLRIRCTNVSAGVFDGSSMTVRAVWKKKYK